MRERKKAASPAVERGWRLDFVWKMMLFCRFLKSKFILSF
jgi:hypothetical protein